MISKRQKLFSAITVALAMAGCGDQHNVSPVSGSPVVFKGDTVSLETLKNSAEAGDAKSQFSLALRYRDGNGVEKNLSTAFQWFMKSAENGNAEAMYQVGTSFKEGKGVRKDRDQAKLWMKKGAEAGNPDAQYAHARSFGLTHRSTLILGKKEEKPDYARQYVEWLNKAASQNHIKAKYELGMTYLLGASENWSDNTGKKLIDPNPDKGVVLLSESADAGYWLAQWALAVLNQSGFGKFKINKDEADKYWRLLEGQTDRDVQTLIGNLYSENDKRSYKTGKNKYKGKELSFDETNKVALEWYQKAAEKNEKQAIYHIGNMYRDGVGVYKNEQKAFEYFKRAAELGDTLAQMEVAVAYLKGQGVIKDYTEANNWLVKLANQDSPEFGYAWARNTLGVLYEFGWGVDKDTVISYAWYNIAASSGYKEAKQNLVRVEKAINPEELREAQTLSREWLPGQPMVRAQAAQSGMSGTTEMSGGSGSIRKSLKLASVGTGFFISKDGNVLTNNHVVEGCGEIRIPAENTVGKLVVADQANDLALLKLDITGKPSVEFPDSDDIKQGEEVFVFGFPLDGYLPSAGNITPGIISALAGPGNNSSLVQITAPVQPGNSGGPLLNKKGKVVGVVVGKANAIKIAKVTGDIPQNINFAIAPRTIKSFLDGNRVDYKKRANTFSFDKDSIAIADEARKTSLKIECWR